LLLLSCGGTSHVEKADSHPATHPAANCDPSIGATTLYTATDGTLAQAVISGSVVVIAATNSVGAVPVSGGTYEVLAQEVAPHGLAVLSGLVYFEGLDMVPGVDATAPDESVPTLFQVPVDGGALATIPNFGSFVPLASDDTSLYLSAGSARILRWDPTAATSIELDIDSTLLVDDVTVAGDYVYVAAQDISQGGFSNGLIGRIPRAGGSLERVVTGIGHPFHVAADTAGIYWAEDPPGLVGNASGRLVRTALGGGDTMTLVETEPVSVAAMNGMVVFSLGTEIDTIPNNGGTVRTVVTGLTNAGMIVAQNGRLIWVDPVSQSIGSANSPMVMSACVGP
jgi:hypothetical protein